MFWNAPDYGYFVLRRKVFIPLFLLVLAVVCPRLQGSAQEQESAHRVNASGTYIRSGKGYLYAANVQPAAAVANILSNGTVGAIKGMLITTFVLKMASAIPQARLALAVKYLWQYRMLVYYWDYYLYTVTESWNYGVNRVGRMPVYVSSRHIDQQILIHWLYPLDDEKPIQLEITPMPIDSPADSEQKEFSPTEEAFQILIDRLRLHQALRMKVWLDSNNLQIALQQSDGRWSYRAVPRPVKVLLEEAIRSWQGRPEVPVAPSLLTPDSLQYLADSLVCQESLKDGWSSSAVNVVETFANTLFEVARTEDGVCDFLVVSDLSSNVISFTGYQHIRTGINCGAAPLVISHYAYSGYQDELIRKAHNSMLPGWASTLLFRVIEEGLAAGTRFAADYAWNTYVPFEPSPGFAGKWGSQQGHDVIQPMEPGSLFSRAVGHAPKALTVAGPVKEDIEFSSSMCIWNIAPSAGN